MYISTLTGIVVTLPSDHVELNFYSWQVHFGSCLTKILVPDHDKHTCLWIGRAGSESTPVLMILLCQEFSFHVYKYVLEKLDDS